MKYLTRNNILKVPEGIVAKSNKLGIWGEVLIFYKLKLNRTDGYFNSIKEMALYLGLSYSYTYKVIIKLQEYNLIRELDGHYWLESYDDLFSILGYDMTLKVSTKGIHRGNFKIFKIHIKNIIDLANLEELVFCEELKLKGARQSYKKALLTQQREENITVNKLKLSCRGVSDLFNFTSSSTGHSILKRLEKLNFIEVLKIVDNGFFLTNQINFIERTGI